MMNTNFSRKWPFYIENLQQLQSEAPRLGLQLEFDDNSDSLSNSLALGKRHLSNRFCMQPVSANDALSDGAPSPLTLRRYLRGARGGFGMIWVEPATSGYGALLQDGRLILNNKTLLAFSSLVESVREADRNTCEQNPILILQLNCDLPLNSPASDANSLTDSEIDFARDRLIAAAALAARAGFDGISLQVCHGALPELLLTAFQRYGKYGGSFENRTRFSRETLMGIRASHQRLITAIRLNVFHARSNPPGFGLDASNCRKVDPLEPVAFARMMREDGLDLLNITANSPNLRGSPDDRAARPFADYEIGDEHPLTTLSRNMSLSRLMRETAPGLAVVVGGFTWLRHFIPNAAAAALRLGAADIIGLGRTELAYPDIPRDLLETGRLNAKRCCILCQACVEMKRTGAQVGCVVHDRAIYGQRYRLLRRFAYDRLVYEAERCHGCAPAQCVAAAPGNMDIPSCIRHFAGNRLDDAFNVIRRSNLLPEMSMSVAPAKYIGENDCVETALSGRSVAIRDIINEISRMARDRGITGVRIPPRQAAGRGVAIVGGGAAGVAAAARLLEHGHRVVLFERKHKLGGVPELLIPESRFPGTSAEIKALLAPGVEKGLIDIRLGEEFGAGAPALDDLLKSFDAVLIATGLWQERRLEKTRGVIDALSFLETAKAGKNDLCLESVAILSGGDCAMDAAAVARELGASRVYIVFPGPRSEMHWCMEEIFFAEPGVYAMMLTRPMEYETDDSGAVKALRVCPVRVGADGSWQDAPGSQYAITVNSVIEARGLETEFKLRNALRGIKLACDGRVATRSSSSFLTNIHGVYAAGAVINGGASVPQCVTEGMRAADEIHTSLAMLSCKAQSNCETTSVVRQAIAVRREIHENKNRVINGL